MIREPFTTDQYIDMAEEALASIGVTSDPATAQGLLLLAAIKAQLATAKAVMELEATISQFLTEYMSR